MSSMWSFILYQVEEAVIIAIDITAFAAEEIISLPWKAILVAMIVSLVLVY